MIAKVKRLFVIQNVFVKYGLDDLFLKGSKKSWLRYLFLISPTRWISDNTRKLPRGERIRLALEELGPVFVKLGQALSTRQDLLPTDIGAELVLLQDQVPPFAGSKARLEIEESLGESVETLFQSFTEEPMASASIAQVHAATLHDGSDVVVKVLRPNIVDTIDRDVALMYLLADLARYFLSDSKRLKPREVVAEYDKTIHDELDLVLEGSNAVVLRSNFKDADNLYVPEVYWDYTRRNVLVLERIHGISIREVEQMKAVGIDMEKLAETGVEIFYKQVFEHNFFHADMHPGNIFVSEEHKKAPQYIAVDFGIIGSLTDEDQRYIGENLLAFIEKDYRRVAQLHVDSGWVPPHTRVSEFESAIRAVCEPIFDKPLAEISFGTVLTQLFYTARRFEMEVQPQLVLLQKTLMNIEGLGRQLYPELDLWKTGKPFLQSWMKKRHDPVLIAKRFAQQAPAVLAVLPDMPLLVHDYLQQQTGRNPMSSSATVQRTSNGENSSSSSNNSGLKQVIVGSTLLLSAVLLSVASTLSSGDEGGWISWGLGLVGLVLLLMGLFR
ncbi:MAG: ubiquinone biosynthesis regulatory protein kinase UbiB [Gammaproteobacteria bacterium]|nr:ubiquinone biosynthesis regulatory protein kinase UbiB [Gammaproteobacteria bacterium]